MSIEVPAVTAGDMDPAAARSAQSTSGAARERVAGAHRRQIERQGKPNARLGPGDVERHCGRGAEVERLLAQAMSRLSLSARGYHRVLKVARTIADVAGSEAIERRPCRGSDRLPARDRQCLSETEIAGVCGPGVRCPVFCWQDYCPQVPGVAVRSRAVPGAALRRQTWPESVHRATRHPSIHVRFARTLIPIAEQSPTNRLRRTTRAAASAGCASSIGSAGCGRSASASGFSASRRCSGSIASLGSSGRCWWRTGSSGLTRPGSSHSGRPTPSVRSFVT